MSEIDYAGVVSEFTAISQYLYHHFFFKDIDKDLGEPLERQPYLLRQRSLRPA